MPSARKQGDACLASALLIAFLFVASPVDGQSCPDNSACSADTQKAPDLSTFDETSMLQTVQVQSSRKIKVERSAKSIPNIIYVRIPKTASTTCCEVTRRIAEHHGSSGVYERRSWPSINGEPGIWADHGQLNTGEEGFWTEDGPLNGGAAIDDHTAVDAAWPEQADHFDEKVTKAYDGLPSWTDMQKFKLPSFLWATVREPKKRAMSYYYWHADLFADKELTTESKMIYLKAYGNDNQYRYMRPRSFWTLDDTLKEYDLVAVTERLDESLVVLAALLKIPLGDVVYLAASSKSCASGAFKQCHPEIYDEPLEVQEYINNTFPSLNRIDHDLYKKANEMLDAKIASMKLEPVIQQFQKLVADVSDKCSPGADLMLDCYVEDAGCHHECVSSFRASTLEMCEWCDSEM